MGQVDKWSTTYSYVVEFSNYSLIAHVANGVFLMKRLSSVSSFPFQCSGNLVLTSMANDPALNPVKTG